MNKESKITVNNLIYALLFLVFGIILLTSTEDLITIVSKVIGGVLITIGMILINSGRDVVDTGTAGMQSQKIQAFNSQFTAYEGTRKGSEIRNLINTVNASNSTDENHQVMVSCTAKGGTSNVHTSISDLVLNLYPIFSSSSCISVPIFSPLIFID